MVAVTVAAKDLDSSRGPFRVCIDRNMIDENESERDLPTGYRTRDPIAWFFLILYTG